RSGGTRDAPAASAARQGAPGGGPSRSSDRRGRSRAGGLRRGVRTGRSAPSSCRLAVAARSLPGPRRRPVRGRPSPRGDRSGLPAFAPAVPLIPPEGSALPRKYRQMRVDHPDLAGGLLPRLAAAGLALGLVALLAAVARTSPENLLLPFPWEQPARDALVRNQ